MRRPLRALGADKPTEQVEDHEIERVVERKQEGKQLGEEAEKNRLERTYWQDLKWSLRGSVERQAQHESNRLKANRQVG